MKNRLRVGSVVYLVMLLAVFTTAAQSKKQAGAAPSTGVTQARSDSLLTAQQLACLGFIGDGQLPMDLYIAGTHIEGMSTLGSAGTMIFFEGPGRKNARPGQIFRIVRAEGKVHDRLTKGLIGYYYKEVGTARINEAGSAEGTATIVTSCDPIVKGDLLVPAQDRPVTRFTGALSTARTPLPENGLASSIILAKDDIRELGQGHVCFIGVGARDNVKVGDRFTAYRVQPNFDTKDLIANTTHGAMSYEKVQAGAYEREMIRLLKARKIAPRVIGDLVVVDVGKTTAAVKIVNSLFEMHLGDLIVKR